MSSSKGSLFGFLIGMNIVTSLLAAGLLYLMTGKLPVPQKGGAQLMSVDQAAEQLGALTEKLAERHHE